MVIDGCIFLIVFIVLLCLEKTCCYNKKYFRPIYFVALFAFCFFGFYTVSGIAGEFGADVVTYANDISAASQEYFFVRRQRSKADARNRWDVVQSYHPKYDNYVLVIGESERKDYMSLYDYPLKTTPFLDSVNGVFIDGYYSVTSSTNSSLLNSLYWKRGAKLNSEPEMFFGNIIQLAHKAGLRTFWISNNNSSWTADISPLITQAQYFDKKKAEQMYDDELLPKLEHFLAMSMQRDGVHNLFVLHLNGQHEPYCNKLRGKPIFQNLPGNIGCYLQSIYEGDQLLERITRILQRHGSWSLMYFSDHGLVSYGRNALRHASNDRHFRQAFEVPMLKISSDDTQRTFIRARKSGFNFIYAFAEFIGVREKHLGQSYCFWCEKDDESVSVMVGKRDFYRIVGASLLDVDALEDDPPKMPMQE